MCLLRNIVINDVPVQTNMIIMMTTTMLMIMMMTMTMMTMMTMRCDANAFRGNVCQHWRIGLRASLKHPAKSLCATCGRKLAPCSRSRAGTVVTSFSYTTPPTTLPNPKTRRRRVTPAQLVRPALGKPLSTLRASGPGCSAPLEGTSTPPATPQGRLYYFHNTLRPPPHPEPNRLHRQTRCRSASGSLLA